MRIGLVDPAGWVYSVDTPYERPLGGTQSALCYLAVELTRLGHQIAIFNGNLIPSESRGVHQRHLSEIAAPGVSKTFDVFVVINAPIGRQLRREARVRVPLVLWNQHSHDQQACSLLNDPDERKAWSAFAFVSDWQRENFERVYSIPKAKTQVMRNAVSPAFAEKANASPQPMTGEAPVLFYSSTPFRGLDVLLHAFPTIRGAVAGARLRIFSGMGIYQVPAERDEFKYLYDQARSMEGVEYIGPVGQSRLATELTGATALAFPSTFAETSCITVIEAMAVGAAVITTRLGALPETTGGLAYLLEPQADKARLAEDFAAKTIEVLSDMQRDPSSALERQKERMKYVREKYSWRDRAKEWESWLSKIAG
jgi:glycosyltransferase involved in cell wall biosynthesis